MYSAYSIAGLILVVTLVITAFLSKGKTKKRKFITWGISTSIVLAPIVSWMLGIAYALYEGEGFAGVAVMMLLYPTLVVTGIVLIIVGIVNKKKPAEPIEE